MSRLLLVRHGKTTPNNAKRFWGQTDVELSAIGIKQAERLRDRLAEQKIDAIYASKLKRVRHTADIISSRHGLDIRTCDELAELNFGFVEGLTFEEIKRLHPDFAAILNDWNCRPRFPGGESLDELNSRLQIFLKKLRTHKPEETVLVVAHAGTLRVIICNLLSIEIEHWRQMQIDFASLSILDTYPEGAILSSLNDVSHLKI